MGTLSIIFSVAVALAAVLGALQVPWLLDAGQTSKDEDLVQALAAAQNYTFSTVLDGPPLIYLDDFLSSTEIDEILSISSSLFVPSQVYGADASSQSHRTSSSCLLPSTHPLTAVVSARALQFLSTFTKTSSMKSGTKTEPSLSYYGLEDIQLVKYLPDQYYHYHVDWFDTLLRDNLPGKGEAGRGRGRYYNRVASFFIYLHDDCIGGETEFPDLDFPSDVLILDDSQEAGAIEFWNLRIDLSKKPNAHKPHTTASGISFKPRRGSGIFWVNLLPIGYGDDRVRHAGVPVQQGQKVGMNIWVKRDFGW